MFQPRDYRSWVQTPELVAYTVKIKETDLYIRTLEDLSVLAFRIVKKHREALETYISFHPFFASSFEPVDVEENAPQIVREMASASALAGVGPMAAVAGAISQLLGEELSEMSGEVIVENGGDNYLRSRKERIVAIYAGRSPLSGKIGLRFLPEDMPLGVCTSSGTVGPSISLGKADAAVIISPSAALADAAATAVGNVLKSAEDIPAALEIARGITGVTGAVVIKDEKLGAWGKLEICPFDINCGG
jgi:ApbE superfamily uncharacterized protein (UPF0280 family)